MSYILGSHPELTDRTRTPVTASSNFPDTVARGLPFLLCVVCNTSIPVQKVHHRMSFSELHGFSLLEMIEGTRLNPAPSRRFLTLWTLRGYILKLYSLRQL